MSAARRVTVRTVHLGRTFTDGGRSITINYTQRLLQCAYRLPAHDMLPGTLSITVVTHRLGVRERLHPAHLRGGWHLRIVDQDGQEVARFGNWEAAHETTSL